jgi:hypothetical protein
MVRLAAGNARARLTWVVTLGVIVFAIGGVSALVELRSHDFIAIYAAASLVFAGHGGAIVDPGAVLAAERAAEPTRTVLLPWVQPPVVALVLAPLAALPFAAASVVMTAISTACLTWSVHRLGILADATQRARLFALALFAPPATIALTQGQTSPFVLALIALSIAASPFWRGVALGLTLIRPQTFALFALAGLGERRGALGLASGAGVVVLGSVLVVGVDGMLAYGAALLDAGGWSVTGEEGLRAAISWVGPAIALGTPAFGLVATAASLAIGAIIVLRSHDRERIVAASSWAALGSPHVLLHDGLLSYPGVAARSWSTVRLAIIVGTGYLAALLHQAGLPVAPLWLLGVAWMRAARREPDLLLGPQGSNLTT